ncbi:MAG: hypothetical protein GXP29_14845 [Planctomycetes bacterium]|nr:hypothetical protein [Planctomycetota bacterium]
MTITDKSSRKNYSITPKNLRAFRNCGILCMLMATNAVICSLLVGLSSSIGMQTSLLGLAYFSCAAGFFKKRFWISGITNGLVLLTFLGSVGVWYQTGQNMGVLPNLLLLLLLWQNNKIVRFIY